MAMPIKVMVTLTTRTNMPKEGITIIKHMAMVTTTRGRKPDPNIPRKFARLTETTAMDTMERAKVLKGVIPPKVPLTVKLKAKATPMEDITSPVTKTTVISTTTRVMENTHGADVVIPRRTPRLSATSQ